jgi:DNA mismatch endonuclease (patch repair protein)
VADIYSAAKRSEIMRQVRSRDTRLELRVRSALHGMGFRFRLHAPGLPGHPDIVLSRHRKVIFVHGCFWHQHSRCPRSKLPETNADWWQKKLRRNVERDRQVGRDLRNMGWKVLVVWQCRVTTHMRLETFLRRLLSRSDAHRGDA